MIRVDRVPSREELLLAATVTEADIADAKRISTLRAPTMYPAFYAELIDPENDPGPIADADP
jgi:hypothetical protein